MKYCLILIYFIISSFTQEDAKYFSTYNGKISFRSEAQQEIIKASSSNLRGVLDPSSRTFIFKVIVRTFQGFNSALQQEHFNEKYLESEKYPEAVFNGKIIEDIDFSKDGIYEVRAKGKLNIHGIESERIIRVNAVIKGGVINIESHFSLLLSDFNIKVPKVVHEKIAGEIIVDLKAELTRK